MYKRIFKETRPIEIQTRFKKFFKDYIIHPNDKNNLYTKFNILINYLQNQQSEKDFDKYIKSVYLNIIEQVQKKSFFNIKDFVYDLEWVGVNSIVKKDLENKIIKDFNKVYNEINW